MNEIQHDFKLTLICENPLQDVRSFPSRAFLYVEYLFCIPTKCTYDIKYSTTQDTGTEQKQNMGSLWAPYGP